MEPLKAQKLFFILENESGTRCRVKVSQEIDSQKDVMRRNCSFWDFILNCIFYSKTLRQLHLVAEALQHIHS